MACTLREEKLTGIFPKAWIASVCTKASNFLDFSAIVATSWITPVSLLANITDTMLGGYSDRALSTSLITIRPELSTMSCRNPHSSFVFCANSLAGRRTQGCSIELTIIREVFRCPTAPWINRLLASDPPLVKTTCDGCTSIESATCFRAWLIAWRPAIPRLWPLDGLPNLFWKYGIIASNTSSSTLVVALWSK